MRHAGDVPDEPAPDALAQLRWLQTPEGRSAAACAAGLLAEGADLLILSARDVLAIVK